MANVLAPFGLLHTGYYGGAAPSYGQITGTLAKADGPVYHGDLVKQLNTGYVSQWSNATSVTSSIGVMVSTLYLAVTTGITTNAQYYAASAASADPSIIMIPTLGGPAPTFIIQSDGNGGTAVAFADIGANADIIVGTGNTTTGISGSTLSVASINTTATLPLKIVGLYSQVNPNAPNGADDTTPYNWVLVRINNAALLGT